MKQKNETKIPDIVFDCEIIKIENYYSDRLEVKVENMFLSEENIDVLLEIIGIKKLKKVVDTYRDDFPEKN
jgi:hypothetical protein